MVDGVVHVQIGVQPRLLGSIRFGNREPGLEPGQEFGVARKPTAPFAILDQHDRFVTRLVREELVVVYLDRADDDVDGVRLHVHPRIVARPVIVGLESGRTELEVPLEAVVIGQGRRVSKQRRGGAHLVLEGHVIGDRFQLTCGIALDERIEAPQRLAVDLIRRGVEFVDRHVGRVEPGALRALADARNEGTVCVHPVPRAEVDLHATPHARVRDRIELAFPRAEHLEPVDLVHALGRVDQDRDHRPLVDGQAAQVRGKPDCREAFEPIVIDDAHRDGTLWGIGRILAPGLAAG